MDLFLIPNKVMLDDLSNIKESQKNLKKTPYPFYYIYFWDLTNNILELIIAIDDLEC